MRRLWHIIFIFCILHVILGKQNPLSIPDTSAQYTQFAPIGIIDVGAGPKYREYKRYLPIDPSMSLYSTLSENQPLNIRTVPRKTTQHVNTSREAIANAIAQT